MTCFLKDWSLMGNQILLTYQISAGIKGFHILLGSSHWKRTRIGDLSAFMCWHQDSGGSMCGYCFCSPSSPQIFDTIRLHVLVILTDWRLRQAGSRTTFSYAWATGSFRTQVMLDVCLWQGNKQYLVKASFKAGMHLFQATQVELRHLGMLSEPIITSIRVLSWSKWKQCKWRWCPFQAILWQWICSCRGLFFKCNSHLSACIWKELLALCIGSQVFLSFEDLGWPDMLEPLLVTSDRSAADLLFGGNKMLSHLTIPVW